MLCPYKCPYPPPPLLPLRRSKLAFTQRNFSACLQKIASDETWSEKVRVKVKEQSALIKQLLKEKQALEEQLQLQGKAEDEEDVFTQLKEISSEESDTDDKPTKVNPNQ